MQEAGATCDIELAYTLADGLEYLRTGEFLKDVLKVEGRKVGSGINEGVQLLAGVTQMLNLSSLLFISEIDSLYEYNLTATGW